MNKFGHFELILFIYLFVLVQYITRIQNDFYKSYCHIRMLKDEDGEVGNNSRPSTFQYLQLFCDHL